METGRGRLQRRLGLALLLTLLASAAVADLVLARALRHGLRAEEAVAWVCVVAALAAWLLTLWVGRSLARPIRELTDSVRRLAAGDYAARARLPADSEHRPLADAINELAGRLQETVGELSRDRAQLSTILAHIVEAVAAVDAEGRLVAANPALRALLGPSEILSAGRPFAQSLRHPQLQDLLSAVLKERRSRVAEVSIFTPQELHFEAHAVPLVESGRQTGALLVLHDITRLRRLEKMRRDFVANVSHELRTPLASIRGLAETLRDGALEDPEHRLEFVEAIENDAQRLSALVEDLLDLSAIESGQRRLHREPLDILALAREAATSLKPLAERRRVTISVTKEAVPLVHADRGQLKQVLANLLDNAVKFNSEGGSVSVSASADGGALTVSVRDTGPGIPAEDLPRVFERFYRVDKARTRDVGGTGLGLAIVKHIVEAHGGGVSVSSTLGEGATFRFTLPAAP